MVILPKSGLRENCGKQKPHTLIENVNKYFFLFIFLFRPRSKGEYLFVIGQLFFGLLLFATVLGHVANIVTSVSAARKEFQGESSSNSSHASSFTLAY